MMTLETSLTPPHIEQLVYYEYDIYPDHMEQHGKVRKLASNRGLFALKKTAVDSSQMRFLDRLFRYLQEQQFPAFLPFQPNKYGDPFVEMEGNCYYGVRWVNDHAEEKYKDDWPCLVLRRLGHLHRLTLLFTEPQRIPPLSPEVIVRRWQYRLEKMEEYKQLARERKLMSPIEISFASHFEYLKDLGQQAIRYLREWRHKLEKQMDAYQRTVVCHRRIHRQHVLHDQNGLYLINFDYAVLDSPVRDLALFYRRHIEPSAQWDKETGFKWLAAYEEEFPLKKEEKLLLGIYLLFPERVFKEIDAYYQGKRDIHPLTLSRHFEQQIELTRSIRHFVREMIQTDLKI